MANRVKNIVGNKYGMLTVVSYSHYERKRHYWNCVCECGKDVIRSRDSLTTKPNQIKSCGCYRKEVSKQFFTNNNPNKKHGLSNTRLYKIYMKMKERCYDPNYKERHYYLDRGITICDYWLNDFMNFYNWSMENGYNDNLSIDRIDVDKGYSPDNCRWVSNTVQANNKRNNKYLTYNGKTQTYAQWSKELHISYSTIISRVRSGIIDVSKILEVNDRRQYRGK